MEDYKCSCGKVFNTIEEYLEHMKTKIAEENQKTMEKEAGI